MDYYDKIWYSKNEDEIKKNQYMIMLDLDKKELENMPLEDISKATGLSIEEINEISNAKSHLLSLKYLQNYSFLLGYM